MVTWTDADEARHAAAVAALNEGRVLDALTSAEDGPAEVQALLASGWQAMADTIASVVGSGALTLPEALHEVLINSLELQPDAESALALSYRTGLAKKRLHPELLAALWIGLARRGGFRAMGLGVPSGTCVLIDDAAYDPVGGGEVVLDPKLAAIVPMLSSSSESFAMLQGFSDRALYAGVLRRRALFASEAGAHALAYQMQRLAVSVIEHGAWPYFEVGESAVAAGDLDEGVAWFERARAAASEDERNELEARIVLALSSDGGLEA